MAKRFAFRFATYATALCLRAGCGLRNNIAAVGVTGCFDGGRFRQTAYGTGRDLCAGCGADLNREACRCTKKEVDPRLAKLAALLAEMPDDEE